MGFVETNVRVEYYTLARLSHLVLCFVLRFTLLRIADTFIVRPDKDKPGSVPHDGLH